MIRHSQQEVPREACGILAGRTVEDGAWVLEVHPCENVHPNPMMEYLIRPEDQLRVFQQIEENAEVELLGFYHSHPQGPNSPSEIDASKNYWPGYSLAIVSLLPTPEVTFWRWKEGRFRPEELVRERF